MAPEETDMSDSPEANLAWQAFRYVSHDMAWQELAQFEARLEVDQAAREAVAEAVQLSDLVVVVAQSTTPTHATPTSAEPSRCAISETRGVRPRSFSLWMRRVGWMSVGVAASVLCGVTMHFWRDGESDLFSPEGMGNQSIAPGRGTEGPQWLEGLSNAWASLEVVAPQFDEEPQFDDQKDDDDKDDSIPEWLLAAVSVTHPADLAEPDEPVLEN